MINPDLLCLKCMNQMSNPNFCTCCGSPTLVKQELDSALPLRTILNGRYLIGSMLGAGGFGITYTGYDLVNNIKVAIKEFMPTGLANRHPGSTIINIQGKQNTFNDSKIRFLEEARMIYQYKNHPHIIQIYSLFEENNTAYYVMEYLYGYDLKHYIDMSGGKLYWQTLLPIAGQIMDALYVLHRNGIVHRDISPDNIFIGPNNRATLIDFGASRQYVAGKQLTVILKRKYAPIEQYKTNGNQGPWTDIYALGSTIYHCLTGILPPEATDRVHQDQLIPFGNLGIQLPHNIEAAIYKSINVLPENRYQNVIDFKNDLFGISISKNHTLVCHNGIYKGMHLTLTENLTIGRDPSVCQLIYPGQAKGISNSHCVLIFDNNRNTVSICDLGSTYGTFLNSLPIQPKQYYTLTPGDMISFGENQVWIYNC